MPNRLPLLVLLVVLPSSFALAETTAPPVTGGVIERVIVRAKAGAGGGLIGRQTEAVSRSTVTAEFTAKQPPTSNAFELLRLVPGANVSTSDPYGLSPSVNISVRGLNGDEIAYLVEGAPVNDIGYYSGYPSQWADAENIRSVSLQQGTVDLDTPAVNAGGGLVSLNLRDPADQAGGSASASYGSYHANREFIRADSGPIANTAARGFVSVSDTGADNYRGPGRDHRQHMDFKLVDEWGAGNRIAIAGSYHDATLSAYPMPTLSAWKSAGRSNNDDAAFSPGDVNYFRLYEQTWHDEQVSAPSRLTLAENVALQVTPYLEHGYGNSPYGLTLPSTGLFQGTQPITGITIPNARNGQALVLADYVGNQYRAGMTTQLIATIGPHRLVAGWWYDYADDDDTQPFTPVSPSGDPASLWGYPFTIKLPDGRTLAAQQAHTREQVNMLFAGDTITIPGARLIVDLGFKYAMVSRQGTNGLPGPQNHVGATSAQPLPRMAVRYNATPDTQFFASVSTNFRSASEYALYDTYDVLGNQLSRGAAQRDEYSISEELGVRTQGRWGNASISAFNYNFTNRQVSTLINGVIGTSINAGGETSRGLDGEVGLLPIGHWRPYLSAEFLHATMDNDYAANGVRLRTAGKVAVRSPAIQAALGIDYDAGRYFGNLAVKYVGAQYATFTNDERIGSHTQADAALGIRLPSTGVVQKPELRLNLVNVTDAKFLSGIATAQPNKSAPPTYTIGPGVAAILTLTAEY